MMRQQCETAACASPTGATPVDMIRLAGGNFTMGSNRHYPEEEPAHTRYVGEFWIDPHPVTNKEFSARCNDWIRHGPRDAAFSRGLS